MSLERTVEDAAVELIRRAVTALPADVIAELEKAVKTEADEAPVRELGAMIENVREAGRCTLPMCQDTGIPLFFVTLGSFRINRLEEVLAAAVRRATAEVPLRKNVVHPVTRANTGDNTGIDMPHVAYSFHDADYLEISYMPKGAGSENMSALAMLNPSQGVQGIRKFVVETIAKAEGKPCPPVIVGVGLGGSSDMCMAMAKKALLRPLGQHSADPAMARLEAELLAMINRTGVGPMGLGGRTTALAVHVEWASCHTASLPVGLNVQCYAARRATMRVYPDGRTEFRGD
ncbi:fumarate hydratase [Methanocella sp. MCL-LM]|uniref:fumarate hydratase n=1 Tax=Methanocella sp. MCL-LM TaxID=3412035 RepID=UPI003C706B57